MFFIDRPFLHELTKNSFKPKSNQLTLVETRISEDIISEFDN